MTAVLASLYFTLLLILCSSSYLANALVPATKTFRLSNGGALERYTAEFSSNYATLPFSAYPFRLCFYNTTPNAFTLAVGMGDLNSHLGIKWVWTANRSRPVKRNAVLSFGQDGNLVLSDSDGSVAWQTGTANQGVVDLSLLSNGNLVLVDGKGKIIWQSFSFPGDTLLPGQSLLLNGPTKLLGRVSDQDGSQGPYSFEMTKSLWTLNFKGLPYYRSVEPSNGRIANMTFSTGLDGDVEYKLTLQTSIVGSPFSGSSITTFTKFNTTYSILRMGSDGNVYFYSFVENVNQDAWKTSYKFFDRDKTLTQRECSLPENCGQLGVCQNEQCIGCPRPGGLVGWSRSCSPPLQPPCGAAAKYFTAVGVDQFLSVYGSGVRPVSMEDCRSRCSKDCKCLGFSYNSTSSRCFTTPFIGSLSAVDDLTHVFYIKTA